MAWREIGMPVRRDDTCSVLSSSLRAEEVPVDYVLIGSHTSYFLVVITFLAFRPRKRNPFPKINKKKTKPFPQDKQFI
jgi:hypothetical protein